MSKAQLEAIVTPADFSLSLQMCVPSNES